MINVDPAIVPKVILRTGEQIPCIGLGTFGSDHASAQSVAASVAGALRCGYRMLDCASIYQNEDLIGNEIDRAIQEKVLKRDELFIISKVWNDMHGRGDVLLSCAKSLKDLKVDFLDAYVVHWPFPNHHDPGCDGDARNNASVPFSVDRFMATWRQMEKLYMMGLTRHIGMSNMTIPKLKAVLPLCTIQPALLELEMHPSFQQRELFEYAHSQGIQTIGYSPIGSPNRPDRDKSATDIVDTEMPVIKEIAERNHIHPVHVCLKWGVQNGQIPIPFSLNNYASNLEAVVGMPLTQDEMNRINDADAGCRLVKGQVFLWPGAKGWEDLWDVNGIIVE